MNSIFLKFSFSSLVAFIFAIAYLLSLKLAIGMLAIIVAVILVVKVPLEKMAIVFLFIYPLLPHHVGFYLLPFLPVFKIKRLAIFLIIFAFMRHCNKDKTYTTFYNEFYLKFELMLFLGIAMISTFFATGSLPFALYFPVSFIFETFIFCFIAFYVCEKKGYKFFLCLLSISAFFVALIAIFEKVSGVNPYAYLPTFNEGMKYAVTTQMREGAMRVRSSFDHAITLGCYLVLCIPAIMETLKDKKLLFVPIFLGFVAVILCTQSRAAIIGLVLIFLLMYIFMNNRYKKNIFIVFLLSIVGLIFLISSSYFEGFLVKASIYLNPFSTNSNALISTLARFKQLDYITEIVFLRPFLGYGHGTAARLTYGLNTIDCRFLSVLFYFGFIGLASYMFLLASNFVKAALSKTRDFFEYKKIILISFLVYYFMLITVSLRSFDFVFWMYIGMLVSLKSRKDCIKK